MNQIPALRKQNVIGPILIVPLALMLLLAQLDFPFVEASSSGPSTGSVQGRDELHIQLTNSGFTPNAVQHAPGTFAIAVENSTISGDYTLRLKAHDGTVLKEVAVQKGSSAWTVSLGAGEYTITEINNPNWICNLTVH